MKTVLVFGDRKWDDYDFLRDRLNQIHSKVGIAKIVSGHANGADKMGERFAAEIGVECLVFPAQWERYGRAAGPIRNQQMLDEGGVEYGVGFHDKIEESRGTKDMMSRLLKAELPVEIVSHKEGSKVYLPEHFWDVLA